MKLGFRYFSTFLQNDLIMLKVNKQLTVFSKLSRRFVSAFPGKELKEVFVLLNISPRAKQSCVVGSMLPASYGLSGPKLQSVNGKWITTDNHR